MKFQNGSLRSSQGGARIGRCDAFCIRRGDVSSIIARDGIGLIRSEYSHRVQGCVRGAGRDAIAVAARMFTMRSS